jgi:hypothetical protein
MLMPAQLRRDIFVALSIKAALLTALLIGLSLAMPRPVADDVATASAVLGEFQPTLSESVKEDRP